VPGRPLEDLPIFTDEELEWVEGPAETVSRPEPAPARPARSARATRPPRGQPRTIRRDAARVENALVRLAAAIPLWLLLVIVCGLLAVVAALALRGGDSASDVDERPSAQTPQDEPVGSPSAVTGRMLRPGEQGELVRGLQAGLILLGFGPEAPDGLFGDTTVAAVAAFQRARGLTADGVYGPVTAAALATALKERARAEATTAGQGLTAAVQSGRLSAKSAQRHQAVLTNALKQFDKVPPARTTYIAVVMRDAAAHASAYDEQVALSLFGMIDASARYFAKHKLRAERGDIEDANGVVYRFSRLHGFQFHPIANFARLNKLAAREDRDAVARLSRALLARGIPNGDALLWEYFFPYGGPSRWRSAFAQATAAQALARAGRLLDDPDVSAGARSAFVALRKGLVMQLGGGLWVREYGFSDSPILNAQLQSLVSLHDYVDITGDDDAARTVSELDTATRNLLARFDTGCWSLYALGGSPASVDYHTYHVSLLGQLTRITGARVYEQTAARWEGFLRQSPSGCSS
jgi:hypothetical protein